MNAEYRFRFSEEHLLTSFTHHRQQAWWRRLFPVPKWVLTGAFCFAVVFAVYKGIPTLAGFSGGILGLLLLGRPIESWNMRRQFRRSPFHNDQIALTLSESGSHAVGLDSEVRIGWERFTKARRVKDGLLLYQGPGVFNWLPDAAAVDPAAPMRALELARTRVKDYLEA
jgi:hypothetical protein